MMLLLFNDDFPKRPHCFIVDAGQRLDLFLHVPKHDALDSHRGGSDGATAGDTRHCAEDEAAEAAPKIASAAALASPCQFVAKPCAMPPFVSKEMIKLRHHLRCSPAGKPPLRQIDTYRAMLARVIDLYHAVAKGLSRV
jgi:hypothetical protein